MEKLPQHLQADFAGIERGYHLHDQGYVLEAIDDVVNGALPNDDKVKLIDAVLAAHIESKG